MTRVLVVDPVAPDPAAIDEAAEVIQAGRLVAFPTETVYGLGADALNPAAVARVFEAKGRPGDDPVIVHVLDAAGARAVAEMVPAAAARLMAAFWPGPLTLVLPKSRHVPAIVTAALDSVAIRAPAHPVARALIAAAGRPIAAPSANRFGHISPTTARHVLADLGYLVDLVLDGGPTSVGVESTVLDARSEPFIVLRPGGVTLEQLRAHAPGTGLGGRLDEIGAQRAPGQLQRHYAPRARLALLTGEAPAVRACLVEAAAQLLALGWVPGLLVADEDRPALAGHAPELVESLGPLGDTDAVARHLYAGLRALDEAGARVILARDWGTADLALAVHDRLSRAAEGRVVAVTASDVAGAAARAVAALVNADPTQSRRQ